MFQIHKLITALILIGAVSVSGCNSLKKMVKMAKDQELTVEPSPLEVHGDSVNFDMTATLPVKMLKKGKVYTANAFYVSGDSARVDAGSIEFRADDFPNSKKEQPKKSASFSFPYEGPDMNKGTLYVQGVASNPENDKSAETPNMEVAKGLIAISKLVEVPTFVAYGTSGYNNQEELEPTSVNFYFSQGSAVLRPSEVRSERGDMLRNFIAEKNVTRSVSITGTHSPEGSERINSRLSENRAGKIEEYYKDQMDRYDYQGAAGSIDFILKPVVDDWTQFRDSLETYDGISESQKQEYFSIIDGPGSFEEKEDRMHRLPTYRQVFRDVYPRLRTAQTEVLTVKDKKTDAQISTLAKQMSSGNIDMDTLSNEELLYAGTLTPSADERVQIYAAAIKKQDSWQAHNNLGAAYLQQALEAGESERADIIEKAMTQLELSIKKKDNAEAHANLAIASMMQGNRQQAQEHIQMASEMTPSIEGTSAGISGIRGAIEIMNANYDQAVSTLSNAQESAVNQFNLGLAQILTGNYENALTSFQDALSQDQQMAMAHYGTAIANARLQNENAVYEALSKAVSANPELREQALNDLVFANYSDAQGFRDSLK